jgi:integrase
MQGCVWATPFRSNGRMSILRKGCLAIAHRKRNLTSRSPCILRCKSTLNQSREIRLGKYCPLLRLERFLEDRVYHISLCKSCAQQVLMLSRSGGHNSRIFSKRSLHSLRHTFVSQMANAGVAPELRQKLAGHSSGGSHRKYTHLELQILRAAIEELPAQ